MHIVFVCGEYPVDGRPTGGFGTYVKNISTALAALGHKVTVVTRSPEAKIEVSHRLTIRALASGLGYLNDHTTGMFKRVIAFLDYPFIFSWQVKNTLNQLQDLEQVDVIEGGDFAAELFFYLLVKNISYPVVVVKLHTPSFVIRKFNNGNCNLFFRIMEFCEKFILKRADKVYSPTNDLAKLVSKEYGIKIPEIIPYPAFKFKKLTVKRMRNLIMYVGKLQTKKGVFILASAIPKILETHPKTKFIFIGPDTLENGRSVKLQLLSQLLPYSNSIRFVEETHQTKLARYYAQASMIVAPSLWENLPNVLIEAAVSNCPIIAAKAGGIPELFSHRKVCILITPGNADNLVTAVSLLLENGALRNMLAKNAFASVRSKLDSTKIANATMKFYEGVAKAIAAE